MKDSIHYMYVRMIEHFYDITNARIVKVVHAIVIEKRQYQTHVDIIEFHSQGLHRH